MKIKENIALFMGQSQGYLCSSCVQCNGIPESYHVNMIIGLCTM